MCGHALAYAQDAAPVARNILEILSQPFLLDEHRVLVTASIGIAVCAPTEGDRLLKDADDAQITGAIIGLAHNLRLKVVAEGVETDKQLAFLRARGCDLAQGFYLGRPQPANDLTGLLREKRETLPGVS